MLDKDFYENIQLGPKSQFPDAVTSKIPNFDDSICLRWMDKFFPNGSRKNETIQLTNKSRSNVRCFCVISESWLETIVASTIALAKGLHSKNRKFEVQILSP